MAMANYFFSRTYICRCSLKRTIAERVFSSFRTRLCSPHYVLWCAEQRTIAGKVNGQQINTGLL